MVRPFSPKPARLLHLVDFASYPWSRNRINEAPKRVVVQFARNVRGVKENREAIPRMGYRDLAGVVSGTENGANGLVAGLAGVLKGGIAAADSRGTLIVGL